MGENRSIFNFKQFTLAHGNPGLKISTEACLFGAWASQFATGKILDIGTGCGLLACMLAQSNPTSSFDAIEIHQEVARLATENIKNSPFVNQIQVIQSDIRSISARANYDFIISNPPFFSNHLPASSIDKQIALHDDALSLADLAIAIKSNIKPDGHFAVIYPKDVLDKFEKVLEENGLFVHHLVYIFPKFNSKILRVFCLGSTKIKEKSSEDFYIKDEKNQYTEAFKSMLKPYYLIFE